MNKEKKYVTSGKLFEDVDIGQLEPLCVYNGKATSDPKNAQTRIATTLATYKLL